MRKMLDKKEIEKIIEEHGGGGEPEAYLKSANVNGNTLTLTNKDNTTVVFTPEGGGSVDIDNKTIVQNAQGKIETAVGGYITQVPGGTLDYVDYVSNSSYYSQTEPLFEYTGDAAGLLANMGLATTLGLRPNQFTTTNDYNVIVKVNGETVWQMLNGNVAYNMMGPGGTAAILVNAASGPNRISINTPTEAQGMNYFRIKVYSTSSAMVFAETDNVTLYIEGPDPSSPAVDTYNPLDGRFLPVDGTSITLNSNNALQGFSGSYNDLTNKPTLFSGDYNDLTNKPTIPAAVSGVNDGTNWTSLTIGSDTYGIGGGSAPSNYVTTDTAQTISGAKTFSDTIVANGNNSIELKANGYRGIYAKSGSLGYEDKITMTSSNSTGSIVQTVTKSAGAGAVSLTFNAFSSGSSFYSDSGTNLGASSAPWGNLYVNNAIQIGSTTLSEAQLQALLALLNQ